MNGKDLTNSFATSSAAPLTIAAAMLAALITLASCGQPEEPRTSREELGGFRYVSTYEGHRSEGMGTSSATVFCKQGIQKVLLHACNIGEKENISDHPPFQAWADDGARHHLEMKAITWSCVQGEPSQALWEEMEQGELLFLKKRGVVREVSLKNFTAAYEKEKQRCRRDS